MKYAARYIILIVFIFIGLMPCVSAVLQPGGGGIYSNVINLNVATPDNSAHYYDQMNIILSNATGSNSGGSQYVTPEIYTSGTTRADWADINFTNGAGSTSIPFWIWTNTATATTVNVTVYLAGPITNTNTSIQLYYGNSSQAASLSSGSTVFIPNSFDDFTGSNINSAMWVNGSSISGGTYTNAVSGGYMQISTSTNGAQSGLATSHAVSVVNTTVYSRFNVTPYATLTATNVYASTDVNPAQTGNWMGIYLAAGAGSSYYGHYDNYNGGHNLFGASGIAQGTQEVYASSRNASGVYWTVNGGNPVYATTGVLATAGNISWKASDYGATAAIFVDWVFEENHTAESAPIITSFSTPGMPPVSSFVANQTTYNDYPMAVQFTDTSTSGPTAWNWSFGDGYTSTSQNPLHVYTVANNYTVVMNASNSNGVGANVIGYVNLTSDVDSNVVSWMHLNQTPITDIQGNAWVTSGATISATTYKFGGGSLSIQGNRQYIYSTSANTWNIGNNPAELEFWIYPTSIGNARNIVSRTSSNGGGTTGGWGFYNGGSDSTYGFWMGALANETNTFTIPENTWSHITIAIPSSGLIQVYENGAYIANMTRPSGSYDTANPIVIGQGASVGNPFYYLDEFRMSTGTQRFTMNPFSPPYAQYNGNLFYVYPNINTNATLLYKSWPGNATPIINITQPHTRTLQIQNITNATSISVGITYPSQFENILGNPTINSTGAATYPDLQLTSVNDSVNGIVYVNVSRSGGGGISSLFLNRTSIVDVLFNYYNYSAAQSFTTGFANATIVDGQHGVSYGITNFDINYIPLGTWTIYPNITSNATTAAVGSSIQFTDQSLGEPTGWTNFSWAFGDGGTSNAQNPTYAYSSIGNYTVTYTSSLVANASVTNTTTMYENITAAPAPAPVASFTANPVMASVGSPVYFTDTSINSPTSWSWTFGDSSGSNLQNPSHIYTLAGNYNVSLTASNSNGSNTTTKTNYINVTVYSGGYTRQDFTMAPKYTLQVTFTDSSTNNVIPVVSVSDNLGNNATTSNGIYTGTYPYSVVVIYASSSGYNSASQSYVVAGNTVGTMQLTKTSTTSNSVLNLLYPQQVQFQILDAWGNYLTGTSVTATMINSVNNNTNWFSTLFGISSSATPLNTTIMYATTDSMGIVSFPMIQSAEYQLTFNNPTLGVNAVRTVAPLQNNYMWVLPDSLTGPITQQANVLKYSLPIYPPASSYPATVYLMGNYSDSLTETNYVNFYFTDYFGNLLYNLTIDNPTGNVSAQYAVANVQGNQYRWGLNASTQGFGFVEQDSGIMLQGNSANGTSGNLFNKSCNDWACDKAGYGY